MSGGATGAMQVSKVAAATSRTSMKSRIELSGPTFTRPAPDAAAAE